MYIQKSNLLNIVIFNFLIVYVYFVSWISKIKKMKSTINSRLEIFYNVYISNFQKTKLLKTQIHQSSLKENFKTDNKKLVNIIMNSKRKHPKPLKNLSKI